MLYDDIYHLVESHQSRNAISVLFERCDDLLHSGRFSQLEEEVFNFDWDRLDSHLLVGILAINFPAKEHFKEWDRLVRCVEGELFKIAPDRTEKLVRNFR